MLVASGEVPVIDFPKYPCHTQAMERTWCVKLVTEAHQWLAVLRPGMGSLGLDWNRGR